MAGVERLRWREPIDWRVLLDGADQGIGAAAGLTIARARRSQRVFKRIREKQWERQSAVGAAFVGQFVNQLFLTLDAGELSAQTVRWISGPLPPPVGLSGIARN